MIKMVSNVDNALVMNAVADLYKQLEKLGVDSISGYTPTSFYYDLLNLRHSTYRIFQIKEGDQIGKLTLKIKVDDAWGIDNRINAVDCYNLQKAGECIADTVKRLYN